MMKDEFEEGIKQGADRHLIVKQICKKMTKGKDAKIIAEELDEDLTLVQEIYDTASNYALDYDADKIYDDWKAK